MKKAKGKESRTRKVRACPQSKRTRRKARGKTAELLQFQAQAHAKARRARKS